MSNLYLHKVKKYIFRTLKDTIIFNLDKVHGGYEYEKNFFHKHPKHLKIVSSDQIDFWRYEYHFWNFPIEDITICCDLMTYARPFNNFYNANEIIIEKNVKKVSMLNNLGISQINNITIPFTINCFKNKCDYVKNKLKTLTIYNNNEILVIDLDKNFLEKEVNIEINNMGDYLNIKTSNDNNIIEYKIYLKDDKLEFTKEYLKYQINASEYDSDTEELNIIEIRNKFKDISFKGYFYYIKKVILNKHDMYLLVSDLFNRLNDIEIIEENDMSLIPRNIHICLDKEEYEFMEEREIINDCLLIKTNNYSEHTKYIIVNKDLSVINIETIERIVIDYNTNNFIYDNNILFIPFKALRNKNSLLLKDLIKSSKYIDEVKVQVNKKTFYINLKKVLNDELNDTERIKQYRKSLEKKRLYRKGKRYE